MRVAAAVREARGCLFTRGPTAPAPSCSADPIKFSPFGVHASQSRIPQLITGGVTTAQVATEHSYKPLNVNKIRQEKKYLLGGKSNGTQKKEEEPHMLALNHQQNNQKTQEPCACACETCVLQPKRPTKCTADVLSTTNPNPPLIVWVFRPRFFFFLSLANCPPACLSAVCLPFSSSRRIPANVPSLLSRSPSPAAPAAAAAAPAAAAPPKLLFFLPQDYIAE